MILYLTSRCVYTVTCVTGHIVGMVVAGDSSVRVKAAEECQVAVWLQCSGLGRGYSSTEPHYTTHPLHLHHTSQGCLLGTVDRRSGGHRK